MPNSFRNGKHIATLRLEALEKDKKRPYFCSDCGNIVFFRRGDVVLDQAGEAPIPLMTEVACKNRDCGKTYVVEGFSRKLDTQFNKQTGFKINGYGRS